MSDSRRTINDNKVPTTPVVERHTIVGGWYIETGMVSWPVGDKNYTTVRFGDTYSGESVCLSFGGDELDFLDRKLREVGV
jgi:hypothetical protein